MTWLVLRRRDVRTEVVPLRIAGGPVIPLLACVVVLWMLKSAGLREFLATGGILLAATVLYLLRRRAPAEAMARVQLLS